ncbi:hypothetical protein KIW84_062422 [Lathyrus oleraceus]|uniref:Acyl-CoA oxidase C-alpha1 domain-containing protein n=1 Tax=Pisum sativum TaxID=3888 RepID=A0A9D4W519_PEA|nr:hypothetical protein KIW84_062422 [Pisum sativum]
MQHITTWICKTKEMQHTNSKESNVNEGFTGEGKYVQSSVQRQLIYGTMVYVSQTIVADASTALSRATFIATRYTAVRRQFGSQNGGLETQTASLVFNFIILRLFLIPNQGTMGDLKPALAVHDWDNILLENLSDTRTLQATCELEALVPTSHCSEKDHDPPRGL